MYILKTCGFNLVCSLVAVAWPLHWSMYLGQMLNYLLSSCLYTHLVMCLCLEAVMIAGIDFLVQGVVRASELVAGPLVVAGWVGVEGYVNGRVNALGIGAGADDVFVDVEAAAVVDAVVIDAVVETAAAVVAGARVGVYESAGSDTCAPAAVAAWADGGGPVRGGGPAPLVLEGVAVNGRGAERTWGVGLGLASAGVELVIALVQGHAGMDSLLPVDCPSCVEEYT